MKLLNRIALSMSSVLFFVMSIWAVFFYFAIMKEINDEIDDSLEDFSELVITRSLAGMDVPRSSNGTNNQYYIKEVTEQYVEKNKNNRYIDSTIYIAEKHETEPARVLKTFFRDEKQHYYELLVATPTIEKDDLQQAILEWLTILWITLLLVVFVVNISMFRRNMRPLYILLNWLDKYRLGAINEPLKNNTSIVEFRKLNEAAVRNAHRAEDLYQEQKKFIGNASHEIQTPLAICRNRLELLLEDDTLTEKQIDEIDKVLQTLAGITRLNKSLLLLSRIENNQYSDTELINVNVIITHLLDNFKDIYEHLNLNISFKEKQPFLLQINETLASVLVANILKNAFVHNVKNGKIQIITEKNYLIVRNTGIDKELDTARIFERFYHSENKEGSTGLGLSILKSICKLYNFKCTYSYEEKMHQFSLKK